MGCPSYIGQPRFFIEPFSGYYRIFITVFSSITVNNASLNYNLGIIFLGIQLDFAYTDLSNISRMNTYPKTNTLLKIVGY